MANPKSLSNWGRLAGIAGRGLGIGLRMGVLSRRLSVYLGLAVAVSLVGCSAQEPAQTMVPTATSPAVVPTSQQPTSTMAPTPAGAVTPTLTATSRGEAPKSTPSSYKFLRKWGSDLTGDGQFDSPTSLAVDAAGNVYVVDRGNHRIQKFSSEGAFLTKWGSQGSGDGQFHGPSDVAVDAAGNVYVADAGNARIQKFSSEGVFLAQWWREGSDDGPTGVAVDAAGNIYVLGTAGRIQKFSSEGAFLAQWGSWGSGDGQFRNPTDLAVDAAGNVYVIQIDSQGLIQKFSSEGAFLAKWGGGEGSSDAQFDSPTGVAVDAAGNVYVADSGNHRIQKFSATGQFLTKWGSDLTSDGRLGFPTHVAVDAAGNIYVADSGNNRIQKFSSEGAFLAKWGSEGSGEGQFRGGQFYGSVDIAVDAAGNVYVADFSNFRIQKFSSEGAFLAKWGSEGSDDGQFRYPTGVAVDGAGNVYVVDAENDRIQKFSPEGTFLAKWGREGSGDGQFNFGEFPFAGIAVDATGNVYVADRGNDRIQKFSSEGAFLAKWGSEGSGDGHQFSGLGDIAVDESGNVYIVGIVNVGEGVRDSWIQKFSSEGVLLAKGGSEGQGDGQFRNPAGLAVDAAGNVYVADTGNHRIQVFGPGP